MRCAVFTLVVLAGCSNILGIKDLTGPADGGGGGGGGGDGGGGGGDALPSDASTIDAPGIPSQITISGTVITEGGTATAGVQLFAYSATETTLGSAVSTAGGDFSISLPTGGAPLSFTLVDTNPTDGTRLGLTVPGITADAMVNGFPIATGSDVSQSNAGCRNQIGVNGTIQLAVVGSTGQPASGATISISPAPADFCYINNATGAPDTSLTSTSVAGIAIAYLQMGANSKTYQVTVHLGGAMSTTPVPTYPDVHLYIFDVAP